MISSILKGGLGNYLFQISAGYSKAIDLNTRFVINPSYVQQVHNPLSSYLPNILSKIIIDKNYFFKSKYTELTFDYKEIPNLNSLSIIDGYFQSEKYFVHNKIKILELFECPNEIKYNLNNKFSEILAENTCSIHVRRGNYLTIPEFHPSQDISFYKESVSLMDKNTHFLIFSDDIEWCVNNFDFIEKKTFIKNEKDYEDLYLMSMCNNNIIANSTFSWWGAWLNKNQDKIIITPKTWFGPKYSHLETKDLYCDGWKII